jgi:branched-chain amino acid transport system substrate-binding protein
VTTAFPDALDGNILFENNSGTGDDAEARLYRAVMAKFAPNGDSTGPAMVGYQSMLGLIRAVNAAGTTEVTSEAILTAIRSAKKVPIPVGLGSTFTCDGSAISILPNTCSAEVVISTIKGTTPSSDARLVDVSALFQG